MIPLAIYGIGPVGAFGAGLADWRAALKGEKKVAPEFAEIETGQGLYNLPIFRASTKTLTQFCKSRDLRRLDHFSRMALLGACLACEDSGQNLVGERTGLIVASAYGASATTFSFLDSVIEDGDALASPTLFSNSVHNAAAAHIAKHLKITGPNLSLTQGRLSLPMALLTATQWLAEGRVDTVLCGTVDEYCNVLGYCWQSYRNRKDSAARENNNFGPAPDRRGGPGEGSLFFHLSRARESSAPYGYLEKLELNSAELPSALPFIYSPDSNACACSKNSELLPDQSKHLLEIDLSQICGSFPTTLAFDLAAAATMLFDQTLYLNDSGKEPQHRPFSGSAIGCLQTEGKPLTENNYWITNCLQEKSKPIK